MAPEKSAIKAVFPLSNTELAVVLTAPLAQDGIGGLRFSSKAGLKLKLARTDTRNPARLVLKTNMRSDRVVVDQLTASGLMLDGTRRRVRAVGPAFVPGVQDPSQLKLPHFNSSYPYASTLVGVHVTVACCTGCNGGVHDRDLVVLNHHVGGPWTGIWVRTSKTIDAPYPRWQKVRCAGGVITEYRGSTTVVDEGWMEIQKLVEEPHHAPPPLSLSADDLQNGKALLLKGLDASWVQFDGVRIQGAKTVQPTSGPARTLRLTRNEVTFTDGSGAQATAYLYQPTGLKLQENQTLRQLRGFVHAEAPGRYVVLSDKEEDLIK